MMPPSHCPFVLVEDQDGRRHAIRRQAAIAMLEDAPGTTMLLLSGGRIIVLNQALGAALVLVA